MAQMNLSIPPALKSWIDHRIAQGRHASASDYVRDLVRRDQEAEPDDVKWVRELIAEGLASGLSEETPDTIIDTIIARRRSSNG